MIYAVKKVQMYEMLTIEKIPCSLMEPVIPPFEFDSLLDSWSRHYSLPSFPFLATPLVAFASFSGILPEKLKIVNSLAPDGFSDADRKCKYTMDWMESTENRNRQRATTR